MATCLNDANVGLTFLYHIVHCDLGHSLDPFLDGIGDVRNHLNRLAQIVALSLLADHLLIDLASGDVVVAVKSDIEESFVVAEIEIDFAAIVQNKYLAMLERRKSAGVDIEIGINLDACDLESAVLEQTANARSDDSFTNTADDTASYQNVLHLNKATLDYFRNLF